MKRRIVVKVKEKYELFGEYYDVDTSIKPEHPNSPTQQDQIELEKKQNKLKDIVGEQKNIEWGSQIRSYVFCPYTLVKDNRTNFETTQIDKVMDGDIDEFIYSYLEKEAKANGTSVSK